MSNTTSKLDQLSPEQRRLLALRLKQRKADEPRAPTADEGAGGEYPLAFTQQRLWMLDRLQPGSAAYNMALSARFHQAMDPVLAERAIGEIVRRHGVLRARFEVRDGAPVQVVEPFTAFHLPVHDLSALPKAEREAELIRLATAETTTPFALDRDPVFRARLVVMGAEDAAVLATMHHIVSDGWSLSVFWAEFGALMTAFTQGLASPLPPLPTQFGEHARRERERLSGDALDGLLAWWRRELAGAPTLLEVPTDRPRPAVASQRGAAYVSQLDGSLSERVAALALREGTTPFNVLLAVFQLLLGRYADTDDLLVGTAIAGRRTRDVEPLIGFFANTLVLRGDLSGEPTFRELLARVHAHTLGAFEHQDLPFERLVEEMAPERTLAYSPLVQALFVQNTAHPDQGRGGEGGRDHAVGGVHQELGAAKFDMTFSVTQDGGRTWAGVEYAADLFERDTIERMVGHYATLLDAALATPDAPAASLEMMPAAERGAVHALSAGPDAAYPPTTLHAAFARQAARTPDAVALVFEGRTMTYAQLDARANQLAHRLRRWGVGPEVRVGVCMERGMEMVAALLATLKAGGAYVPLDPEYPPERLAYMLADAAVPVLLTQPRLADTLPAHGARTLAVDPEFAVVRDEPAEAPGDGASPDHLAYAIYTSGSTGNPKGAMNAHRGVVNRLAWMQDEYGLGADDVVLQKTPFSFDVSVWEFFWPLMVGARLVLARPGGHRDPAYLAELIDREGVTTLHFVPSMLAAFLDAAPTGAGGSLARVVCSGEALGAEAVGRFYAWMDAAGNGRAALHNLYGPTEAAVDVTYWPCARGDESGVVPIGRPVANTRIHVLDRRGAPVPVGVPGELHIAGVQVGRGYLGRPALTAEKFVPDPFGPAGARMYRTGDRVRWRADGALLFLGRIDFQVKLRGFRIELGEIEARLLAHPALSAAVAVVRTDGAAGPRLVAYLVPRDGETVPDAAELRAHLREALPEHMVPSVFVPLQALPLTGSGKTDRRALPVPAGPDASAAHVPPRTQTEQVLAALWSELLGVGAVGVGDGFFELGGHSLLATRLGSGVRERLGVEVPLRTVFEHPTLEAFAGQVDRLLRASAGVEAPPLRPADRTGDLPLTFAQERLWFVDRLEPGSPVYHMPFHYLLRGALDVDALRRAFSEIVRRHETLRTALPLAGEQPVQRILPPAPVDVPLHDVSGIADEAERDAATEAVMRGVAGRAFDLERGPLFRAAVVRMADDAHVLAVNLHHVISDGWSVGVLWNELSALYAAFSRGEASPLPEPALQYGDFAVWQREWLSGDVLDAQLGYWREKLAGAPPLLELPTDRPRPAVQTYAGASEFIMMSPEDTAAVLALGRREGSTLFMVLLAAMDIVFGRLAGQDDVVIGTPIAGRTRAETEGMIGLFLNSLALRTDLGGEPTFRELLRRVRETTLEAYAHQDLPFERILEELAPERSLSHSPLFQVMLNLSNFAEGDVSLPGMEVQAIGGAGDVSSKFDLTLYAGEAPDGIFMHLVYNTALFDAPRVRSMLHQVTGVLRQAAEDADRPVHGYSLRTDDAVEVLPDPARPLAVEPWRGAVHQAFAALAARAPDALAAADPGEAWTYGEMDAAADHAAQALVADGVRPGDVAAVWAHRSAALPRALLAAWKAGAAFLVLDPAYPPARLAQYVRIARPAALLLLEAAGPVPDEVRAALDETVRATLVLRRGEADKVAESDASTSPAPAVEVEPDALAYVAFTSGTTGVPKAVAGTHRPLAHFFGWYARELRPRASDRFAVLSGLAHDPLLRDLFAPLTTGGALLLPDPDSLGTAGYLAGWMRDGGVTVAHLTPAMGQLLTRDADGVSLPALRLACFGGDLLPAAEVRALRAAAPAVQVVNFYGATETPQAMAFHRVAAEPDAGAQPVGRGIEGAELLVLVPGGIPAGVGELGEIAIRTPYLSRGYLNDDGLTAARFAPSPWSGDPADRMYRTGDLGRYRPDGAVDVAGRADQQVKVRGFRVEPGEVEAALRAHPGVRQAAVLAHGEGEARLLAAYVTGDGAGDVEALRAYLRARLPEYMVPSAFVPLDALPLTPNGKLDRRALPDPEAVDAAPASEPPRTPTEQVLAAVWAALLRRDRVGRDDDFFALGGHSLLATRLSARVRDALGVELALRAVFEHPRLAALAAEIDRRRGAEEGEGAPPLVAQPRGDTAPASFAQERLWFVDRLEGGGPVYHMPSAHHLRGAVRVDALQRALDELVRRHEALRTALPQAAEGGPVQRILPPTPVELAVHDLSGVDDDARGAALEAVSREHADRPFDLLVGPLFRAALVRLDADEHVLLLNVHHAVSDGWSNRVLVGELTALHEAFLRGEPSPLPPLAVQYADYAIWQRQWLRGAVLERQLAYWRRTLVGAPALLELPTDRPRPPVQTHRGASEVLLLSREHTDAVLALGRREGSTLFMVLLAAWSLVLGRLAGQDDVVVGTPIAGRTSRETEALIGLFLNSLALRTDLSGDPSFRELLRRVRDAALGAYAHQDIPFERILEDVRPERSLSHTPVFQVMLNVLNFQEADSAGGLERTALGAGAQMASKFDVTLYVAETEDGLVMHAVYAADLFAAARMREMLAQLAGVLAQAAEDVARPIHAYSLLTDEAAALLPDPATALNAEWRGSVPELFARHAARTPDAVAVEDPVERWTYAELDAASTHVARRLMADGVRPGDVVAILGHRSAPLVRALLGAMKAGGAFLILDPAYPPARLAEYVRIARPTGFLPLASAGEVPDELSDALRESVVSTLPLAVRESGFVDKAANSAEADQPLQAGSGEVASLSEPEGAYSAAGRSAANPAEHQPPPVFFGGGASLSERRGRGGSDENQLHATSFVDKAANSAEADQPPPAVSGEVASLGEPEGAFSAASGGDADLVVKVANSTDSIDAEAFPAIGPDSLAYLSFTSGTTGKPKAVMGRHGSLTHFTPWLAERFELRASDRFSLLSGLAHDPLHRDVFTPLQLGAAVVAPDPERVGAPGYLARWMRDTGITVTHLTPAMGQLLVDVPGGLSDEHSVDSLRRAFFVGDVLTRTDVGRMHRLAPNLQVINYYGSTETQRAVAHFVVPRDLAELARETIPVGVGIPDVQVLIRNAAGERVGVGEVGEIWMRSPHVALGYLGDEELTASRFVPNPWTGDPADPTYRTGDLGRYRPDGVAEIAGRADQQVKIRGFRIEPGEIEAALRAHAAVRDTVVVPRGDGDARRLVAYVVADGEPAPGELREWLRAAVPEYMVPAAWVFLPALPVTPNGKVDRKALPEPEADAAARAFVPPRTPTEVALAEVWAGLMKVDRVGADDDFFALGGHSLLATKMVARVRDALGVELPLRALFESPVLSALAAATDRLLRADAVAAAPPIVHRPHHGTAPASFAQERMWFVDRMEGGGGVYHVPRALHLSGDVDPEALRRAVEEVVRRHETLRTALPEVDGVPVQRISPPGRVELPLADLSGMDRDARDAEAARLAERNANAPFDLEAGPLFRASLVRLAPREHLLLVNLHHAVGDGWSLRVLLDEISTLHAAFARGEPSPLPPLPVQYADYAAWQREWLSGPVLESQLAYWRGALAGAPPVLALPTDRPRPPVQGHRGASESVWIAPDDAARVLELARREGATLFMVLLAALNVVLARWSGQHDVVVGTPVAGRTRSELEGLIGLFLNSLALRTDLSGDPTFRALLGRVRETTLQAYAHQDVPFERILEDLRPERSRAHTPVFQVLLNLLNYQEGTAGPGDADGDGAAATSLGAGTQIGSKFDLTLYATETPDGIRLHAVYDAELFDGARMRSLLAQVAGVLRQAVDDADRPAAALSLWTDDAASVLPDPSAPIAPEPWRGAVHERVAAVAASRPDAPAVREPRGTWTYAQVEAGAAHVARGLMDAGVAPGDVVAVLAHRSAALVPALLGVWKAGAAFLVLDPAYPPARLADYVRVAAPRALVRLSAAGQVPAPVADALAPTSLATVVVGGVPVDGDAPRRPHVPVDPDGLAYVAFTSGSTGQPKAIAGTHRPLPHFFDWYGRTFGLNADDRFTLLSGLAHDPLLRDLFAPLLAGGTLVVPDPGQLGAPGYLAEWMRAEGVTVAHLTPAMGQLLAADDDDEDAADPASPAALRLACLGGEVLRAHDVRRLRAFAPGVTVANFYGATETPQAMAAFVVPAALDALPDTLPVGRGIDRVDLLVLRPDGAPAGIGEVGEIVIRTPFLSRGYLNDDALTAARFVANPATGAPGDRMYRTGDLGRYRPDGTVQVAGRADQQLKLRGFRVEPGEVEAALRAHPAIRDAAVVAYGEGDAARLAAYLVAPGEPPRAAELREALRGRLPEHMVPSAFVFLPALPLTPNGKLDRRALPAPRAKGRNAEAGSGAPAYVPPATEAEGVMAEVWGEVLGAERVGMDDDFFALGGHSLLGARLLARVRRRFGRVLPLDELFRSPTPRALAAAVAGTDARDGGNLVAIQPRGALPPFVCVHPAGGTVFHYAEMARLLAPHQPFYGVQATGLNGETEPLGTVTDLAERYLGELLRLQPRGPYYLGGWSAGGVVALEMADRLAAAGHEVATVALFDSRTPDFHQLRRVLDPVNFYRDYAASLVAADAAELSALEAELRALDPERRLERLSAWMESRGAEAAEVERIGAGLRVFQATAAATREHHVRPYAGRVDLFCAREGTAGEGMEEAAIAEKWRALGVANLRVHPVPGTHTSMIMPPHVQVLTAALREALAESRVDAGAESSS